MKTKTLILLAIWVTLLAASAPATTVVRPTFDELVDEAQLIFEGTVTDVRCEWIGNGAERGIVSYVTFAIKDTLKGSPAGTYTLQMIGGTIGDETIAIADAPVFKKGDRDILFVENNGRQFIPLVGIMYGRFRVQPGLIPSQEIVTDHSGGPVAGVANLKAADFKTAIRAKLATTGH